MEVGKISEGIAATIDLLESLPVRVKDLEILGFGVLTAIKNLRIINEVVIKAENDKSVQSAEELDGVQLELVPEDGDRA